MPHVAGIDHVAFAARDLEETCAFYDRLFGARTHLDYAPEGKSLVRQIALGGALLSIHQAGNGLELVARHPTVGGRTSACAGRGASRAPPNCCAGMMFPSSTGRRAGGPPTGIRRSRSISEILMVICWS